MFTPERLLKWMKMAVLRQTLDGGHFMTVRLYRQDGTRLDRLSIHQHGTGAAVGGIAANMGAGQPEIIAEKVDQEQSGLDLSLMLPAIDDERDGYFHLKPPSRE